MTLHLPLCPRTPDECPPPGIYRDIPGSDYHAWNAVSSGLVKRLHNDAPIHALHSFNSEPKLPTAAMRLGTALHAAFLEPEVYAAATTIDGLKPNAQPATFARHEKEHGPLILAEGWHDDITGMVTNLQRQPKCPRFDEGHRELCIVWDQPTSDGFTVRCKARIDHFHDGVMSDIKTARSIDPHEFGTQAYKLGYPISFAHYTQALSCHFDVSKCLIPCVETAAPFDAAVYECSRAWLDRGLSQWAAAINKLATCLALDNWPGAGEGVEELELPGWARSQ
ncbi:MAG: PD-(D/E)XK nuclease-like domain-containing protein [Planctomycetota bacterium]|nr:PD-(D/E)XK nuclease-like domain-containing protein [Planctomycetota bacterium]